MYEKVSGQTEGIKTISICSFSIKLDKSATLYLPKTFTFFRCLRIEPLTFPKTFIFNFGYCGSNLSISFIINAPLSIVIFPSMQMLILSCFSIVTFLNGVTECGITEILFSVLGQKVNRIFFVEFEKTIISSTISLRKLNQFFCHSSILSIEIGSFLNCLKQF